MPHNAIRFSEISGIECLAPCLVHTKHPINDTHYFYKCEAPPAPSLGAGVRVAE